MPRNIRWDDSVKANVLNLVDALLSQADDELDDLELKVVVQVEWVTQNKLRVTGNEKRTISKRDRSVEVGTRKEHLVKLVKKLGKSLKLPKPKEESGSSQQDRELEEVQTALDCLKELGVREDQKSAKNQGYWKFTLMLKHQTATREENLEVVKQKWQEHPKTNFLETSSTTPILETEKSIDWRNICRTMLEKQKQLTTNRLMRADEMLFDIDRIRVDLALVERKQTDKRSEDDNPARSQLYKPDYEETQKLEYEEFLTKVLKSEQSKKLAIIGEPGAGKTTLLQRIAFWILDNTDDLPIWIPLGNFPNPAPKFKHYLLNDWLEDTPLSVTPKIKAEFEERLIAGKVWLLLDGVDEMAAKSGSPLTVIANRIVGWCCCLRVVLTCRLNVWEANPYSLNGFQTYRTLEFSEEKVEEFINACFQKSDAELGIGLQQALNQPGKERIKDLVRNPLRLTLLCSTWHLRDGKLPDTKAELYQQFVEEVYRWQDKEKEVYTITPEQREQLNTKLKKLAVAAIDNETNRFCLRHKFVEGVFRDSSLFQLALDVGWLNQVGVDAKNPHQPVYAFFHPTFQEYFAALAIDDWDDFLPRNHNDKPIENRKAECRYRIFEPQWKEVILLWLGRPKEEVPDKQKEEFIQKLVDFQDGCGDFYGYRAYFLAAAGIAELVDYDQSNKTEIVEEIVKLSFGYFNDNNWWMTFLELIAEQAREVLQETVREKVIAALVRLLDSFVGKGEYTHQQIAESLVKIGVSNSTAINLLEQRMESAKRKSTPRRAAECLGRIDSGNRKAIDKLERLIELTEDRDTRCQVADSLLKINPDNLVAINVLVQIIESSRGESIGGWAAESLGKIDSENPKIIVEVIPVLEQLIKLSRNRNIFTCLQAADSVGKIQPDNQTAIKALVELMQPSEDGRDLRLWAVESLVQIGTKNSAVVGEKLLKLVELTEDEYTRFLAANSLMTIGFSKQEAIQTLKELINSDKDEYICCQAADSLVKNNRNDTEAVNKLKKQFLKSNDESTRCLAANSLARIDSTNQEVIQNLRQLISSRNKFICRQAVDGLMQVRQKNQLKECLTDGRDYLSNEIHTSNDYQYCEYYKLIWHCAQNITYPDFYQSWHPQEEVEKTSTFDSQSLNQADLPQSLQSAIANDPQLSQIIHLICIDGSQFIERDRPVAEIYDQMLDQNCPECDRVPETMPALKLYWNSLKRKSDKRVVLVFYASSTDATPDEGTTMSCPYSEIFLTDLSKFGDRICVITHQPFNHIRLKFFTFSHVIEDVKDWIRTID